MPSGSGTDLPAFLNLLMEPVTPLNFGLVVVIFSPIRYVYELLPGLPSAFLDPGGTNIAIPAGKLFLGLLWPSRRMIPWTGLQYLKSPDYDTKESRRLVPGQRGFDFSTTPHIGHPSLPIVALGVLPSSISCLSIEWHSWHKLWNGPDQNRCQSPL